MKVNLIFLISIQILNCFASHENLTLVTVDLKDQCQDGHVYDLQEIFQNANPSDGDIYNVRVDFMLNNTSTQELKNSKCISFF